MKISTEKLRASIRIAIKLRGNKGVDKLLLKIFSYEVLCSIRQAAYGSGRLVSFGQTAKKITFNCNHIL